MPQDPYYNTRNHVCVLAFASNLALLAFFFAVGALHPLYNLNDEGDPVLMYRMIAYSIYVLPFLSLFLGWLGMKWATDTSGKRLGIASMVFSVAAFLLIISVPSTFLFPDPDTLP